MPDNGVLDLSELEPVASPADSSQHGSMQLSDLQAIDISQLEPIQPAAKQQPQPSVVKAPPSYQIQTEESPMDRPGQRGIVNVLGPQESKSVEQKAFPPGRGYTRGPGLPGALKETYEELSTPPEIITGAANELANLLPGPAFALQRAALRQGAAMTSPVGVGTIAGFGPALSVVAKIPGAAPALRTLFGAYFATESGKQFLDAAKDREEAWENRDYTALADALANEVVAATSAGLGAKEAITAVPHAAESALAQHNLTAEQLLEQERQRTTPVTGARGTVVSGANVPMEVQPTELSPQGTASRFRVVNPDSGETLHEGDPASVQDFLNKNGGTSLPGAQPGLPAGNPPPPEPTPVPAVPGQPETYSTPTGKVVVTGRENGKTFFQKTLADGSVLSSRLPHEVFDKMVAGSVQAQQPKAISVDELEPAAEKSTEPQQPVAKPAEAAPAAPASPSEEVIQKPASEPVAEQAGAPKAKEENAQEPQPPQQARMDSGSPEVQVMQARMDAGVPKPAGPEEPGVPALPQGNSDQADNKTGTEAVARSAEVDQKKIESLPPVPDGMTRLYRGNATVKGSAPEWVTESPKYQEQKQAEGRWFTEDPKIAQWYVNDSGESGKLHYLDVPTDVVEKSRVRNVPEALKHSLDPDNEVFLPSEYAGKAQPVEKVGHTFSSTQVELPSEFADKARAAAAKIPDDILAENGREDAFHITALYGLHDNEPDAVKKVLEGQGPVKGTLGTVSIFPASEGHNYDVVKVDVKSPDLTELNRKLRELPNGNTFPDYRPHVTLAYVRPGEGKKYVGRVIPGLSGKEITFNAVTFSPKTGEPTSIPLKPAEKSANGQSSTSAADAFKMKAPELAKLAKAGDAGAQTEIDRRAAKNAAKQNKPAEVANKGKELIGQFGGAVQTKHLSNEEVQKVADIFSKAEEKSQSVSEPEGNKRVNVTSGTSKEMLGSVPVEVHREVAKPMLDIRKNPTGWLFRDLSDGRALIHPTEDKVYRFEATDRRNGTQVVESKARAQAYAIDNPVEQKVAEPEKPVSPYFRTGERVEVNLHSGKSGHFGTVDNISTSGQFYNVKMDDGTEREFHRKDVSRTSQQAPKAVKEPVEAKTENEPATTVGIERSHAGQLAEAIYNKLAQGESLGNVTELNKMAEQYFGSSRSSGNWDPKDMFDAMEAGVNKHLIDRGEALMGMPFDKAMVELRDLMSRLTSQGVRTDEQIAAQQFSTPPTESYLASVAAGLQPSDVVLEPSAGNGGLAIWAKGIGAQVYVNEIAERRRKMLEEIGFGIPTAFDGELINSYLDPAIKPTVIVMNPPFSAGVAKSHVAKNNNQYGFNHVNSALQRLAPGGRLVAILGGGRADDMNGGATLLTGPSGKWFADIAKRYNVRANIRINGKEYQKYGTSFATRLIVIDKDGPTPSRLQAKPDWESVVRGVADTIDDAYTLLRGVANDRKGVRPTNETGIGQGKPGNAQDATRGLPSGSVRGVLPRGGQSSESGPLGRRQPGSGGPVAGRSGNGPAATGLANGGGKPGVRLPGSTKNEPAGAPESGLADVNAERPVSDSATDLAASSGVSPQDIVDAAVKALAEKTGRKPNIQPAPAKEKKAAKKEAESPTGETKVIKTEKKATQAETKPKTAISAAADAARQRLRDRLALKAGDPNDEPIRLSVDFKQYPAAIDPQDLVDLATIGAEHMLDGATEYPEWKNRISNDVGDLVEAIAKQAGQAIEDVNRQIYQYAASVAKQFGVDVSPASPAVPPEAAKKETSGNGPDEIPLTLESNDKPQAEVEDTDAYVEYRPSIKGPEHPGAIVETKTMATIPLPTIKYKPHLPAAMLKEGRISAVQLEAVGLAGQQNAIILPGGQRASALIGDGCVAAGTRIYNPLSQSHTPIERLMALGEPHVVLALTAEGFAPRMAHAPFLKGKSKLYRISLSGRQITVTGEHRFLTPDGWRTINQGLAVGDPLALAESGHCLDCGDDPYAPQESVPNYSRRPEDCLDRYWSSASACDGEQLLSGPSSGQVPSPLPAGARERSHDYRHGDARETSPERIHRRQDNDRPSRNSSSQVGSHGHALTESQEPSFDALLQKSKRGTQQISGERSSVGLLENEESIRQSPSHGYGIDQPSFYELPRTGQGSVSSLGNYSRWDRIVSLEFIGVDVFYDMYVPGPENYVAEGLVNHNTGLGKGRESAAILYDNFLQGRKRLVWVSEKWPLMQDAIRDLQGIGAKELVKGNELKANGQYAVTSTSAVRPFGAFKAGEKVKHEGLLFSTYALIRSESKTGQRRADQLEEYLRGDDDGEGAYIVWDESHALKNAVVGQGGQASQIGVAARQLLMNLPKLRTVSLSATAATDVMNLGYLDRLGLWGAGTAFPTGFAEFASQIASGRLAAMELVARELKAQGKYISRTLSFNGVSYEEVEHVVNEDQKELYRTASKAWRAVVTEAEAAIKDSTGGGPRQVSRFLAQFGAAQQRFFNLLITALKVPSAIELTNKALAENKSVVITLVNTNEAAQNREKTKAAGLDDEEDEIPDYDFGPKKMLEDLVKEHFPVQQYADDVDDSGNPIKVPVYTTDEEGRKTPLNNPEAEATRDALLKEISKNLHMPENPLDVLINSLGGPSEVAELTGRKERFDSSVGKFVPRGDPNAARKDVNNFEARHFQTGKKRVAVLSGAAGTGISLHAGNDVPNQQPRYHITLQVGWSADKQMQMFGRTHRTNQKQPPHYVMLVSDLGGEKRFVSTIARRLGSLGAITKGQKNAAAGTDLMEKVNFETEEGKQATRAFYEQLLKNQPIPGTNLTGFQVLNDLRMLEGEPPTVPLKHRENVTRLLNRLLALDPDVQNATYNYFFDIFQAAVQRAIDNGTLDTGVKTLPGDKFNIAEQRSIARDPSTGAETFYYPVDAEIRLNRVSPEELQRRMKARKEDKPVIMTSEDGKMILAVEADPIVHASGSTELASYIISPGNGSWRKRANRAMGKFQEVGVWAKDALEKAESEMRTAEISKKYAREWNQKQVDEQYAKATKELAESKKVAADPKKWALDQWTEEYASAPNHITERKHLIGGAVMKYWNPVREASQFSGIYTATDTKTGKRVVGVDIPEQTIRQLIDRISGGQSTVDAGQLYIDVLRNNLTYSLEGGTKVRRGRVGRENVVQLLPATREIGENLKKLGVIVERGVSPIFYIPTAASKWQQVLDDVLKQYPVEAERPKEEIEAPQPVAPKRIASRGAVEPQVIPESEEPEAMSSNSTPVEITAALKPIADFPVTKVDWGNHAAADSGYVTDGATLILSSAVKSKLGLEALQNPPADGRMKVPKESIEKVWQSALDNSVYPMESMGWAHVEPMSGRQADNANVAYFASRNQGIVHAMDPQYVKLIMDSTGADEVKGPPSGSQSPIVFFKSGEPVALLKGLKPTYPNPSLEKSANGQEPERLSREIPGFYSQLERTIDARMPNRAPAAQVANIIKAPGAGVKEDEVKWSGLDDFLEERKGKPIEKREVLDFLRANATKVTEAVHGTPDTKRIDHRIMQLASGRSAQGLKTARNPEDQPELDRLLKEWDESDASMGQPKYGQYVLPGGSNYRELLLTLPPKPSLEIRKQKIYTVFNAAGEPFRQGIAPIGAEAQRNIDAHPEWRVEYSEEANPNDVNKDKVNYRSSHWEDPNVLAHIRIDDRTGPDGEQILHVSEIQSDWHQEGKRKGYRSIEINPEGELPAGYSVRQTTASEKRYGTHAQWIVVKDNSQIDYIKGEGETLEEAISNALLPGSRLRDDIEKKQSEKPPLAPFSKTWPELSFKRVLRYAAEHGYDTVTWDTGDTQNERYDLSKHLSEISYEPVTDGEGNPNGLYEFSAKDKSGKEVIHEDEITIQRVEELAGKEIAEKIHAGQGEHTGGAYRGWKTLSGLDLKVGGKGMEGFYDKILPDFANKYGKRWGAKVSTMEIQTKRPAHIGVSYANGVDDTEGFDVVEAGEADPIEHFTTEAEAEKYVDGLKDTAKVHAMPVTDAMRESAMQGQPLFAAPVPRGWDSVTVNDPTNQPDPKGITRASYRNGVLWVNSRGMADIVEKGFGRRDILPLGMYIPPRRARELQGMLSGMPGLVEATEAALKESKKLVVVRMDPGDSLARVKATVRHELFHASEEWAGEQRGEELLREPAAQKVARILGSNGYDASNIPLIWSEIGAHLAAGPREWAKIGLSRDEAKDLFAKYLDLAGDYTVERLGRISPELNEELNAARGIARTAADIRQEGVGNDGDTFQSPEGGDIRSGIREIVSRAKSANGRNGGDSERGSFPLGKEIQSVIDRFKQNDDEAKRNYSGLGALKTLLAPGERLAEVEAASKPVFEKALAAGSWQSIASTMTRTAISAIDKTLNGTDYNWTQMRAMLTEDRLNALSDRWSKFASMFSRADESSLKELLNASGEDGKSFFLNLLSNIEGRNGLQQDLGQTAAALMEQNDWDTLRDFVADTFREAAGAVAHILEPAEFDDMVDFFKEDPKGQKAMEIYKKDIEEPLARVHAENEGIFSDAIGKKFGAYIPLVGFEPKPPTAGGRRLPLHKPKNPSNHFATGLSSSYTLSMEGFVDKLSRDVRMNKRAALIQTLRDEKWSQPKPEAWDGTFIGPDGVTYRGVAKQVSEARTLIQHGKVVRISGREDILPDFLWRGLQPMLDREPMNQNDINRVAHFLNGIALKATPAELVYHTSGVLGAINANTPFLGKSKLDKVLSAPVARWFAINAKLISIDPSSPENIGKLREMAEAGAVPSKLGKVTFDKNFADAFGVKQEKLSFAPLLYGPKGVDARARILMYDIFKAAYPDGSKTDLYHFVNQIGNYTPEFQGEIERWSKRTGVGPFATAGMTRLANGLHAWTGMGPGSLGMRALQMFLGGAIAGIALWAIAYKQATGKWPTQDKRAKLLEIPVGSGNGWIDKYRHSAVGNLLWGKGPEVGYLNFGLFFPIVARGARLFGLASSFETHQLGGNARQTADGAEKDILNSLIHPFTGPAFTAATVGLTGLEPSFTGFHERGKPQISLFPAYPVKRKPGFIGGLAPAFSSEQPRKNAGLPSEIGARAAGVAQSLNGFYGNLGEDTGILGSDRGEKGAWYARMAIDLALPGLVKNATNPYARAEMLRKDRAGAK